MKRFFVSVLVLFMGLQVFALETYNAETIDVMFDVVGNSKDTQTGLSLNAGMETGFSLAGITLGLNANVGIGRFAFKHSNLKAKGSWGLNINIAPEAGFTFKTDSFIIQLMAFPICFEEQFMFEKDDETILCQKVKSGVRLSLEFSGNGKEYKGLYVLGNYVWSYGYEHVFNYSEGIEISIGFKISNF